MKRDNLAELFQLQISADSFSYPYLKNGLEAVVVIKMHHWCQVSHGSESRKKVNGGDRKDNHCFGIFRCWLETNSTTLDMHVSYKNRLYH